MTQQFTGPQPAGTTSEPLRDPAQPSLFQPQATVPPLPPQAGLPPRLPVPPAPPAPVRRRLNGAGVAAIVCGAIAVVLGLFPITFIGAFVFATVAAILAIVAWGLAFAGRASKAIAAVATVLVVGGYALGGYGYHVVGSTLDDLSHLGDSSASVDDGTSKGGGTSAGEDSGGGSGGTADAGPAQLAVGQAAVVGDGMGDRFRLKVTDVRVTSTSGVAYGSGPSKKVFVIVDLKVRGLKGKSDFSAGDFHLRTKGGRVTDTSDGNAYDAVDGQDEMTYLTVQKGEVKSGPVAFDSPRAHGKLVYDPNFSGAPVAVWTF